MPIQSNKNIRYYYWLFIEFIKKHNKLIFLSFLISSITAISIITISPYLSSIITRSKKRVGIVGTYRSTEFDSLPDEIISKISSGLTSVTSKGAVIPVLASTWSTSPDGKKYTISIRKNLLLNNGELFTTKHLSYSFKDVTFKIINDSTIEFTLSKPLAIFPFFLTKPVIIYPHVGVAGLYSVQRVKEKNRVIQEVELNPNRKNVQPITYIFFHNEGDMIAAYKRGLISDMTIQNRTMGEAFLSWKNSNVTKRVEYDRLFTFFFNFNKALFKERDFRLAVLSAFPYTELAKYGEIASTSFSPGSWAYHSQINSKQTDIEYSQKTFKRLLSSTASANLKLVTYYDYIDLASLISESLQDTGLKVNVDIATLSPNQSDFDFFLTYIKIPTDPDQYYYWHSTQGLAQLIQYKNLRVDKLLEDGRATYKNNERKETYLELQKVLDDDPPAVFLFFPYSYKVERR